VGRTYDGFRRSLKSGEDEQRSEQRLGIGCGCLESIEPASRFLERAICGSAPATGTAGEIFITKNRGDMQSVTVGQCFRGAWKDAGLAILNRPFMVLIIFAFLLLTGYAQIELRLAIAAAAAAAGGPRFGHAGASLGLTICSIMQMFAIAGLSVQVMRYSLLGAEEARSIGFFDKGYWRYLGLCVLLGLLAAVFAVVCTVIFVFTLLGHGHHSRSAFLMPLLIALVTVGVAMFIFIRLSLLFCHAAIGARASWGAAWRDTRGHFWSIMMIHLMISLPLIGIVISFVAIKQKVVGNIMTDGFAYWSSVGWALWMIFAISLGAACSAWLYRRYSASILEAM